MRISILFICLISLAKLSFGQDNIIKSGSAVILQLTKDSSGNYSYHIISNKPMNKNISMDNTFLKDDVDTMQIKIIFGEGKFGDQTQTLLIIKSGLKAPLNYKAKIKNNQGDFVETSINPLLPKVKSVEMWQEKIDEIILSDFKKFSFN